MIERLIIRNETEKDYAAVENMTREAFWNLYIPGADEHYLVHIMREHEDFISELDFVAELDGQIVGNVMYTKAKLIDEAKNEKNILTFGPLCVDPKLQRRGIGKQLLEHSFEKAVEMGYDTVVIFGTPGNYVGRGFKCCKRYNVCLQNEEFPTAMMVRELKDNTFDGRKWYYHDSPIYDIDETEAEQFDRLFEPKKKKYQASQEEFFIHSHSVVSKEDIDVAGS